MLKKKKREIERKKTKTKKKEKKKSGKKTGILELVAVSLDTCIIVLFMVQAQSTR